MTFGEMFSYRVQTLINAKGQITTYTYDANGNKLTETNYLANTKQYRYDGINRLIEEKDALGNVVQQLEYNDANAQLHSYDALQNKITYLYDRNMRNIGTTDAEGNTTSSTYDTRGNLRTKTDGNGNTTTYHYDSVNRLIKAMYNDFSKGYERQIIGMITFISNYKDGKLLEALQDGDLEEFVTLYNGTGKVDSYTASLKAKMKEYKKA